MNCSIESKKMPPKPKIRRISLTKGKCASYLDTGYKVDFEDMPSDFKFLNGHVLYCLLLNSRSVPPTVRTLDKLVEAEGSKHASVCKLLNEYDGFNKYSYQEAVFTRFKLFCEEDFVIHVPGVIYILVYFFNGR